VSQVSQTITVARSTAVVLNFPKCAPTKIKRYCFSTLSVDGTAIYDFRDLQIGFSCFRLIPTDEICLHRLPGAAV